MAKDSALASLGSASAAGNDLFSLVDTSATVRKTCTAQDLIDFGARASQQGGAGICRYDGTIVLWTQTTFSIAGKVIVTSADALAIAIGRLGATTPGFSVDASVATCVTGIKVTPRAAAAGTSVAVVGGNADEKLTVDAKGAGVLELNLTATGNVKIGPDLQMASTKSIVDANANEILKTAATVASAVNEITITNAATGAAPSLIPTGGDTDITFTLGATGIGCVQLTGPYLDKRTITATTDTTTLTVAQLLTKIIRGVPTAPANYTLPTAANLVAGIKAAKVGDSFNFFINNKSGGANTITVVAGGATLEGTVTVAQNVSRMFVLTVTNVGGGTEAYSVIGQG